MMMKILTGGVSCEDVARRATDYLEKALPLRKSLSMRIHLMMCRHCHAFVRSIEKVSRIAAVLRTRPDRSRDEREVEDLLGDLLRDEPHEIPNP